MASCGYHFSFLVHQREHPPTPGGRKIHISMSRTHTRPTGPQVRLWSAGSKTRVLVERGHSSVTGPATVPVQFGQLQQCQLAGSSWVVCGDTLLPTLALAALLYTHMRLTTRAPPRTVHPGRRDRVGCVGLKFVMPTCVCIPGIRTTTKAPFRIRLVV